MSLKSDIRQTERRIALRRGRLKIALDGVTDSIAKRMVSPGALVAAGLFGAALYQSHRLHGLRLLALLKATNTGLRLLRTPPSRTRPTTATR
jgi:hypothetical protein